MAQKGDRMDDKSSTSKGCYLASKLRPLGFRVRIILEIGAWRLYSMALNLQHFKTANRYTLPSKHEFTWLMSLILQSSCNNTRGIHTVTN